MNKKYVVLALGAAGLIAVAVLVLLPNISKAPTESSDDQNSVAVSVACTQAMTLAIENEDLLDETFQKSASGILASCSSYQEFALALDQGPDTKLPPIANGAKFMAGAMCLGVSSNPAKEPICQGLWDLPGAPPDDQIRGVLAMASEFTRNPELLPDDLLDLVSDQLGLTPEELDEGNQMVRHWLIDETGI